MQPSNIARYIFPNSLDYTTPPHQDFIHIRGSPYIWTTWLPLGDCPHDLGGPSLLVGLHKVGVLPVSSALGAEGLRTDTEGVEAAWISSSFALADVLFFHSHTVHQGLPNLSGDRLWLSVDFRYQRASDPVMDKMLEPHLYRLSWGDAYAD